MLVTLLNSGKEVQIIWKELQQCPTTLFAPVSISGSLLALGGGTKDCVMAIHLYQPGKDEWVKIGDLPAPRCSCTCVMITDKELLVAGGTVDGMRVDIASTSII